MNITKRVDRTIAHTSRRTYHPLVLAAAILVSAPWAAAQEEFSVDWHTIDCGGGQSTVDEWSIVATIAQPEAGSMSGPESVEAFEITGGFWFANLGVGCFANCDGSTGSPVLTGNDFQCFFNKFAQGDPAANCDGSSGTPALTPNDFQCFLNSYAAGCS